MEKISIKKITKKSQVSIEMVAAVGTVLLIFIFMLFFAHQITAEKRSAEERSLTENLCMRMSNMISGLYLSGPGTEFNITIDYNSTFESEKGIFVKSENKESFCHSPIAFTNGTDETFMLKKGAASFRNVDGGIVIQGG